MSQRTRRALLLAAVIAVALLGLFYEAFSIRGGPTSPAPSTEPSLARDCGRYMFNLAECAAVAAAAAKLLDPEVGSRAEVSSVGADMAHVTFVSPAGKQRSADVIASPVGTYAGVNPSYEP